MYIHLFRLGVDVPLYFFDADDGARFVPDDKGLQMESVAAAKAEAERALSEMAKDALLMEIGVTLPSA